MEEIVAEPAHKRKPPESQTITQYDRACFELYLAILDAHACGVGWKSSHSELFPSFVSDPPDDKKAQYLAHLDRAQWICAQGYKELIR